MKYKLLDENEQVQIVKGFNSDNKELCLLYTSIITDGTLAFCTNYSPRPVLGYSDGDYKNPYVDTLMKIDLEFVEVNYMIKVLFAKELVCLNGKNSFVDTIKSIDVGLKDPNDENIINIVNDKLNNLCSKYRISLNVNEYRPHEGVYHNSKVKKK